MIRSVRLQNFESHRDTLVELGPGVNVLTGESEHGKSAILRAIQWVVFNRPLGDDFRSHWGGCTVVTLETDQAKVTRMKGRENKYTIELLVDDQKLTEFKALGAEVPREVQAALGLTALNFQTQFDPHFLLPPVSPGEVAKRLNEAVNLEVIDRAQYNINADIRANRTDLAQTKQIVATSEQALAGLGWVVEADVALAKLEELRLRTEQVRVREQRLNVVIVRAEEIERKLRTLAYLPMAESCLGRLQLLLARRNQQEGRIERLVTIIRAAECLKLDIIKLKTVLTNNEAEFKRLFPERCPLCGQISKK